MGAKKTRLITLIFIIFVTSTVVFATVKPIQAFEVPVFNEKKLGEFCVKNVVPASVIEETDQMTETKKSIKKEPKIEIAGDPLVIIYHTHSSESYMPYKESNYHREDEKGTVREVGDVLEEELEKQGINVIHDKTVHDRPSYNESYSKSLATIQALTKEYPTAVYIIDLHRDAAAASATEGKYTVIEGERVAKFSMVVGQANENYVELYDFAKKVGTRAGEMYEGFGGVIIEKNYNYNEFVSNKALLLEVGNNKNTIEEAKACGRYFANVISSIIKEEQ